MGATKLEKEINFKKKKKINLFEAIKTKEAERTTTDNLQEKEKIYIFSHDK